MNNWLSYYNQAYELNCAIYAIRAKMQSSGEATKMLLDMSVKEVEKFRDTLIQLGDTARAESIKQSSPNPSRPAGNNIWDGINSPAGNGTQT